MEVCGYANGICLAFAILAPWRETPYGFGAKRVSFRAHLLEELKHLGTLYVQNTKVSETEIDRIYDLHPGMSIFPITSAVSAKRLQVNPKP